MKVHTLITVAAVAILGTAALTLNAFMGTNKKQETDNEGHVLASLWKSYNSAAKADRPKQQSEILDKIKEEAKSRRYNWDFYEAVTKKIAVESSRNWKVREQLTQEARKEIYEYDEPVVTYSWNCENRVYDQLEFVVINRARLQAGHNTAFYKNWVNFPGVVFRACIKDDFEYSLWSEFFRNSFNRERAAKLLGEYLDGAYPNAAYMEYALIADSYRSDARTARLEEYARKYKGKAISLYARGLVLKDRRDRLENDPKSTSEDYRALYEDCKAFEKERKSYTSGVDSSVAGSYYDILWMISGLESKDVWMDFDGDKAIVRLRNLNKVDFQMVLNKKGAKPLVKKTLDNPDGRFYVYDTIEVKIPVCDDGDYVVTAKNGKVEARSHYFPSGISIAVKEDDVLRFYAADWKSGKPIEKVDLELRRSGRTVESVKDVVVNGFTEIPEPVRKAFKGDAENSIVASYVDEGGFHRTSRELGIYRMTRMGSYDEKTSVYCSIFTDKSAYNPGETIKFKAVVYEGSFSKGLQALKAGESVKVTLENAEGKEVGALDLKTNEYGSVAGEFELPVGERNGSFTIHVSRKYRLSSKSVIVDEFILPTYDLEFERVDKMYFAGDTVEIRGRLSSYSGHSLSSAALTYEVESYGTGIASGTLEQSPDGSFAVSFPTGKDHYLYSVVVKVTDATGETREFSTMLYILQNINIGLILENPDEGNVKLVPPDWHSCSLLSSGPADIRFEVTNSQGVVVPLPLTYDLKDDEGNTVSSGSVLSGETKGLPLPKSGKYSLTASAKVKPEHDDREITASQTIELLKVAPDERAIPATVENFFRVLGPSAKGTLKSGEDIVLQIGAGNGPLWAVVELYGDKRQSLDRRIVFLNGKAGEEGSIETIVYNYKESDPNALFLSVFYFRNGENYTFRRFFRRERNELEIPLSFTSFKDMALPGKEYSFTLKTVPGAEAVAAVFDKSSETIRPNNWNNLLIRLSDFSAADVSISARNGGVFDYADEQVVVGYGKASLGARIFKSRAPSVASADMMDNYVVEEESLPQADELAGEIPVRSDFSSSLAFEPFLRSDDDGCITLKFRTSDKLSTFVVQAFAHTPQMRNAVIRQEMKVSVPVKVSVVEPKYLYRGDKYVLHASVSNNTGAPVSGLAVLQTYPSRDYIKGKPYSTQSRKLTVPAKGSVEVEFEVNPKDYDEIGLKLSFADNAKTFSDGMFVSVPVSASKQTITEAHSGVVLAGMDEKKVLKRLQSEFTGTSYKGAEYKEIDIRRMILDAIPSKVEPQGKDILSLTESWYVRRVAEHLDSRLTGEVTDAELWSKIKACINADGGFGWFEGMHSSAVITAVVLERFAKLRDAGLDIGDFNPEASVVWLDRTQFLHSDNSLRWCGWLSYAQYAFVRSMYSEIPFDVETETRNQRKEYSENFKDFKKYIKDYLVPSEKDGRGMNGEILNKARRISTLLNLVNNEGGVDLASAWGLKFGSARKMNESAAADAVSLLEYSVDHRNGGMYYPNAVMPWRGLLESELYAHSSICDLMTRMVSVPYLAANLEVPSGTAGPSRVSDGIRIWMMLQKETQKWDDDPAFVDAINSVMSGSEEVLATKVILLTKTYEKPFSEISAAGNGFTIERHFYREVKDDRNRIIMEEILPGAPVRVGDKIIVEYKIWNEENRSFIKVAAPREAGFRPVKQLSGSYGWWLKPLRIDNYFSLTPQGYRNVKSDRTEYYFDIYPEEKTTITEEFFATQEGVFSAPVVTVESLYAPHYRANDKFGGAVRID